MQLVARLLGTAVHLNRSSVKSTFMISVVVSVIEVLTVKYWLEVVLTRLTCTLIYVEVKLISTTTRADWGLVGVTGSHSQ